MTADDKDKLLLSDTLVPDLFITQYMSSLTASSIRIYLMLLMNRSSFGKMNVQTISKKLGYTQKYICEVSGISASYISDLENGKEYALISL